MFRDAVNQLSEYDDTLIPKLHARLPQLKEDPYSILTKAENELMLEILKAHADGKKDLSEKYKALRELAMLDSESLALQALRQLGMQSALVSGAYLDVRKKSKIEAAHFSACAGAIVNQLRDNGIPTDISGNIWPHKDLIREAGFEIKQTGQASNSD
jgi:hypothetical protein